jgi:hypothetical protein
MQQMMASMDTNKKRMNASVWVSVLALPRIPLYVP